MKILRNQVADQARVVAHLAAQIGKVHSELASAYAETNNSGLLLIAGKRTARLMELFGDVLNEMDACSGDDDWTAPIFERAHQMWATEETSEASQRRPGTQP